MSRKAAGTYSDHPLFTMLDPIQQQQFALFLQQL
jgi:hypothetical protein